MADGAIEAAVATTATATATATVTKACVISTKVIRAGTCALGQF